MYTYNDMAQFYGRHQKISIGGALFVLFVIVAVILGFVTKWEFWGLFEKEDEEEEATCPPTFKYNNVTGNCHCEYITMLVDPEEGKCLCHETTTWDETEEKCICNVEGHVFDPTTRTCAHPCPTDSTKYAAIAFSDLGDGPYYVTKGDGLRSEVHGDYSLPHISARGWCATIDSNNMLKTGHLNMEDEGRPKCYTIQGGTTRSITPKDTGFAILLHKDCENYSRTATDPDAENVYKGKDIEFVSGKSAMTISDDNDDYPFCYGNYPGETYGAQGRWYSGGQCGTKKNLHGDNPANQYSFLTYN